MADRITAFSRLRALCGQPVDHPAQQGLEGLQLVGAQPPCGELVAGHRLRGELLAQRLRSRGQPDAGCALVVRVRLTADQAVGGSMATTQLSSRWV